MSSGKALKGKRGKGKSMERSATLAISKWTPDVLLGRRLNTVEAKNAPSILYTAGSMGIPLSGPRVAIVGTRKPDPESVEDAKTLARALTRRGVVVVSGLAKGIDATAHKAAIDAGGKTIAVLGTPLDRTYPAENAGLQAEVIKNHMAISQFKIGSEVFRSNFIRRNRVMALIADASVIVQASESSGSISQGYEALRLGRPLFIWKRLFDSQLAWPKEMEKFGAVRLSEPNELLETLPSRDILQISA